MTLHGYNNLEKHGNSYGMGRRKAGLNQVLINFHRRGPFRLIRIPYSFLNESTGLANAALMLW